MSKWLENFFFFFVVEFSYMYGIAGADPGYQVGGAHLKKLRRAEGGVKIFGVFRVKNHDFTPKNNIFSNFRGARSGCAPSLDPPLYRDFLLTGTSWP